MHICFVIGAMNYSGAEKVLSIVAKELADRNHVISVILLEDEYGAVRNDGKITTYGAKATGSKIVRIITRWKNIRSVVKKISPDVVVSFGSVCNVNTIPSLFFTPFPKVVCERNDPVFDPRSKGDKFVRWLLYRFSNGYVFQTNRIKSYFSKSIQSRAAVIPNPIIDSQIRWSIDEAKNSIATVARLDDFQKDHTTMFEVFSEFEKTHSGYTLDVYGGGPDREKYKHMINELGMDNTIILHGKSSNPMEDIKKSRIFLLTSRFEGMPNALMEALSIGMPCVSTDCGGGGAAELFAMVDSGTLVPVGDKKAILNSIEELISNTEKQKLFSEKAVKINSIISKEVVVDKWEEYLTTFKTIN